MRFAIMLLLLALTAAWAGAQDVRLGSIRFDEYAAGGFQVPVFVSVASTDGSLDDVSVMVVGPELDVYAVSSGRDIEEGDSASFVLLLEIPYAESGDYYLKFSVLGDNGLRRSYYRMISIV